MLSFLRRFSKSPLGIGVFAIILIAFVVTLYEGKSGFGLPGANGGSLATVGGGSIGEAEAIRRTQTQLEAARQQNPTLDMATFVAEGGAERTVEQMINGAALEAFAKSQGLIASRKLVDGAIASIPAFNGPNGKFDRATYLNLLAQRKIPESQLRQDFGREAVTKMLLIPIAGAARVPNGLVVPYASLLLEQRQGQIGAVPSEAFASNAPVTDADVSAFYARNIARYTVPERRVIKYAQFDRSRFEGKVVPTEAEIATAYKSRAGEYAGRQTRSFTQIIVPRQAQAATVLARVKAGSSMAAAARSIGLEALTVPNTDRAAFSRLTGADVAAAAFSVPKGSVAPLAKSGLGFHIVRVDDVATIAPRTLAQVRPELVASLSKIKTDNALADLVAKMEDDINGGATFDEVSKKYALASANTPPITASGLAPEVQGFQLPLELTPVLRDAFQADVGDDATVSAVGNGTSYVLYHMDRVIPSAAKPLAQIKPQVVADAQVDRASKAAKRAADAIAARINKGMPFAQALAGAGVKLPAAQPAGGRRIDIAQAGAKVPPPLALMFGMVEKRAKVLAVPQGAGWYIVYLDRIVPGDPREARPLIAATQQQLSRVIGDEYVAQFATAVKAKVGVKRNDAAIAGLKRSLTGGNAGQ